MTREEYEKLCGEPADGFRPSDLVNQEPRTLVYGYTLERYTFEVSLDWDGEIEITVYDAVGEYKELSNKKYAKYDVVNLSECVPSKRAYPERCDYEFCTVLKKYDVYVPFTTYTDR